MKQPTGDGTLEDLKLALNTREPWKWYPVKSKVRVVNKDKTYTDYFIHHYTPQDDGVVDVALMRTHVPLDVAKYRRVW